MEHENLNVYSTPQPISLQDELQLFDVDKDAIANDASITNNCDEIPDNFEQEPPEETSNFRQIFAKIFTLIRTNTTNAEEVT